ncbi:hypothetical protein EVAR_94643_1 [Eumeta japonica]|uniref:Uncharacterized protein n=1 Tax=Eumeta variegata TaxID=151549 RepID=A0A4C1UTJ2_EUMVA|nr:hypothetical protein EVAR_94643_1 [Eumeta japonica]
MESEINGAQTKKAPKSFSIESIIGNTENRRSPEIDIENNNSEEQTRISEEDDPEQRGEEINRMRYYLNAPFLQAQNGMSNFPFLLGYGEPWLPRLSRFLGTGQGQSPVPQNSAEGEAKRDSPVSVGSELDSDGGEDNNQVLSLRCARARSIWGPADRRQLDYTTSPPLDITMSYAALRHPLRGPARGLATEPPEKAGAVGERVQAWGASVAALKTPRDSSTVEMAVHGSTP